MAYFQSKQDECKVDAEVAYKYADVMMEARK
jgi:hypothetical protein